MREKRNPDLYVVVEGLSKYIVSFVSRRSLEAFQRAWNEICEKDGGPEEAEAMLDRLACRYAGTIEAVD